MYGRGNYGHQFGQGPNTPMPPAYPQRPITPPPPPPPPPPHFQPGHSAAASPLNKNAPSSVRPHVGHPGPHVYHQHGPTAPHPINHQGPNIQVPSCGMLNTGQSYLQVHGNVPLPLPYPNAQQNLRHPSHLGMQNVHHIPPPVPPPPLGPPCSEMLLAPPPLPQGQTLYRVPVQPRLQHPGAVQGLQHITPPPPPPPTYSFSSPAQIENAIISGKSQTPSMVPPPPPSSPPPVPPCPPLFTSSSTSSSTPTQVRHNASVNASNLSQGGGSGSEVGSAAVNGTTDGSAILDLPPPPPKPREEKVVQAIEDLCQLIAKNGPSVEDMTYRDEAKNPEFSFLYGGEPGSEAETAHDYFQWMKKKCILAYKMHEGQSLSLLRPLKSEPSMQSDNLIVEAGCNSPFDSDMEMEDDFTQSDKDHGVNHSFERVNKDCDWIAKKLDPNEQLYVQQSSAEGSSTKDILSEKVACSGFSELGERGLHHDNPKLGSSTSEVHSAVLISAGDSEHPFASNLEKSSTLLSNDLSRSYKTSAAAEAISSDKPFGELIKGGSPFTLLQGYASDDSSENDDKPFREDGSPLTLSPLVTAGAMNSHKDAGCDLGKNVESKGSYKTESGDRLLCESSMPCKAPEISSFSQKEVKDIGMALISSGTTVEHFDFNHVNQASISHASPHEAVWEEDDMVSARTDVSNIAMSPKKNKEKEAQHELSPLKVDEFGRLVKEDATDTDTDDSHYTRRHNKRARSRSHSGSPLDRRRRSRRSPRKRRERRSRSRSWSPRNPRSRSRSPLSRRAGEFSLENRRRDKGQRPECFDFLRGRCYRGASCRYMHHESDRSSESRHQKGKQLYPDVPPSARTSKIREEVHNLSIKVSNHEFEASKSQEMQPYRDVLGNRKDGNISHGSYDTYRDAGQSGISNSDGQVFTSDLINYDSSQDVAVKVREMQVVQEKPEQPTVDPHNDENRRETVDSHQPLSVDGFLSQSVDDVNALKTKGLQNACCSSWLIYDSPISGPSPNRTSMTSPNKFSTSEPFPNVKSSQPWLSIGQLSSEQFSLQSLAPKESSHGITAMGFSHHHSALHPPPGSQGVNAVHMPQGPKDHNLTPQSAHLPFESASGESFHSRQAPLPKQPSQYFVTPNSSWTSLPPPPPQPLYDSTSDAGTATKGVSLQLQESHLLACQNSTRLYHGNKPTYPRVDEFPCEAYPPGLERHQHLSYVEDLGANPVPKINQSGQPFGGTSLLRENRFSHLPVPNLVSSSSFASGNIHSQPMPSSRESFMNETRPSGDDLPPGELTKSPSQSHHYSEQRHPAYGLHSVSTYPPGLPDGDQSSRLLDFGGSRISAHCNPYASTFERPLSSKYSSDAFNQEKDSGNSNKHGSSFNVSHVSVDGLGVGNVRSRHTTSSPCSTKPVGQSLPRSGGDQYDPLFDSIEPSSNSLRRDDYGQNPELSGESDTILGLSGTFKRLDAAEKHKDVGTVASTTSLDNDEYGETADAEVGAVENESPIKVGNMTGGDIEIDQIKSSRKSKKSKDSRSTKLFKIAVADFVKEVLKPSWRQGNMSKEAFKTIVKKTVDKVSGAMKNHHVPKSQAKIDQYIDSSQRKLTKLVMGYVDKYVKV